MVTLLLRPYVTDMAMLRQSPLFRSPHKVQRAGQMEYIAPNTSTASAMTWMANTGHIEPVLR